MLEFEPELKEYPYPVRKKSPKMEEIIRFNREHNLLEIFKDGDERIAMAKIKKAEKKKSMYREVRKDTWMPKYTAPQREIKNFPLISSVEALVGGYKFTPGDLGDELILKYIGETIERKSLPTEKEFSRAQEAIHFFGSWKGFVEMIVAKFPKINQYPNPNETKLSAELILNKIA